MLRAMQGRIQQGSVPNAFEAAKPIEELYLRRKDNFVSYPNRLIHLASSRKAFRYFCIPFSAISIIFAKFASPGVTRSEFSGASVR